MFNRPEFEASKARQAIHMADDQALKSSAFEFVTAADKYDYAYQQTWLGMPIIQLPEDILVTQELFWADRPDVVIETGVAWGGSVVLHASLMELAGKGKVIAIDQVLPPNLRADIMKFSFSHRIQLIEGSSENQDVADAVKAQIGAPDRVAVFLDSNHSHEHVLAELRLYGSLVSKGQHLTVYATAIARMPVSTHRPRPWGPEANPMTALQAYLNETDRFVVDAICERKSLVSFAPQGRLLCVK
jgi:cephalosporin hydroxylase